MYHRNFLLLNGIFVYSSAAVFLIVSGQPTTDDNNDINLVDQLANTVAMLQTELAKLAAKNEKLEATLMDTRKYLYDEISVVLCTVN